MPNIIALLEILKWYTDENHPLTQEKLREIPNASISMGDKNTFKRQIISIADTYNLTKNKDGQTILKEEKDWRIVFPGYKLKKMTIPNEINNRTTQNGRKNYYTGPIYYRHEISTEELCFLIGQIRGISFKEEIDIVSRLIHVIGNKHLYDQLISDTEKKLKDLMDDDAEKEFNEKLQSYNFPIQVSNNLYTNISIIRDAIHRKKMIKFKLSIITDTGEVTIGDHSEYLVSPYRVIFYKGYYWLIGNRRLGSYIDPDSHQPRNKYSDTLDIYRIDKLLDLSIAKESYELRAKTAFTNIDLNKCLDRLSSQIHVYKENSKIQGVKLKENDYGKIEFEILWENFSNNAYRDYSFIFDTFGTSTSIKNINGRDIACVYATNECFIDWALTNINKIRILDTPQNIQIKNEIRNILTCGLKNL